MTRRRTDWFCLRCKRTLHNEGASCRFRDTISWSIDPRRGHVSYVHDRCGGQISPGG